jgi:pimeloyl-ACP methyl ester carboxylesterase
MPNEQSPKPTDDVLASNPAGDVVVLVHGIRTRAQWYNSVKQALEEKRFRVELSNYGRFGLARFLLPIPLFRTSAAWQVERDIRQAMEDHKTDNVSIIAHSFGTYLIAWLLKNRGDLKFKHIIFCGSVVKFGFPFQYVKDHFKRIVNEVGTADIWPILAEIVTWGYGSTGSYGINRPGIVDRYHAGVSHSKFLNAEFCHTWWVPVLNGDAPKPADDTVPPPGWLRFLSILQIKYLVLAGLVYLAVPHFERFLQGPPFMLANVGVTCRPANIEKAPQATKLLVMIYSDDGDYIKQITKNLNQIHDNPKSFAGTNANFKIAKKEGGDEAYDLLTDESRRPEENNLNRDLKKPNNWLAYTVSVNKPDRATQIPIPAPFTKQYQARVYVVMTGSRPSNQPESDEVYRQAFGSPLNKHLLELAELGIKAGEPVPESQETDLDLEAFSVNHQCWKL